MKRYTLSLLTGLALAFLPQLAHAEEYDPDEGDVVVVYRNEFKPESFSKAVKTLAETLKKVAFEDPGVRDSYVMRNKKDSSVIAFVIWDSKKDFEAWKKSGKGKAIGDAVKEFQSKPVDIDEFELFLIDDE